MKDEKINKKLPQVLLIPKDIWDFFKKNPPKIDYKL